MPYRVVEISNFGGLDCRRDPQDAAPIRAIDMADVDIEHGRVRSRPGTTRLISQSTTTSWQSLVTYVRSSTSQPYLITIVPTTAQLRAYNASTGALIATYTVPGASLPASINDAVMLGSPTTTNIMYLAVSSASANLTKFDGTTFTAVAGVGSGTHLAVQSPDNRTAMAWGVAAYPSRVSFSNASNPDVWGADDYVDLSPGDGEEIVGLENFREFLIAFKQSAFYVFYGNSTDATGGTVFNYRPVRHNLATPAYAGKVTVAGREGVYFLAKDGIYVTDGGYPRKVSGALDPLFTGSDNAGYFTAVEEIGGGTFPNLDMEYVGGRLYLRIGDSKLFVYDPQQDLWLFWELLSGGSMSIQGITPVLLAGGDREVPYFLSVGGTTPNIRSVISYLDPANSLGDEDNGSLFRGFNGSYRTNFMDLGEPGTEKVVREILVDGYLSGKHIGFRMNDEQGGLLANFQTVTTAPTAGTWPDYRVGRGRARRAYRARNFSFSVGATFASTNAPWALHRVLLHLRGQRSPGVEGT